MIPKPRTQDNCEAQKSSGIEARLAELLDANVIKNIDELMKILPCKEALDMELLFIIVYCVVSDFFEHIGGQQVLRRSNNNNPGFTDAEVITIVLVGQLAGENSQRAWYRYVRKNYLALFPNLCSRSRFSRREAGLHYLICYFQQNLCSLLAASDSREFLVDSFPLEICNIQRLSNSSQPFEYAGANIGYCAAKKHRYYGFKCHIVTDLRGVPIFIALTSAGKSDLHSFEFVVEQMILLGIVKREKIYVGDKGYVGQDFAEYILRNYGVRLVSMQREYKKNKYGPSALNQVLGKTRKIIETTINLFSVQINAGRTKRRTIKGLMSSLMSKLAAFNLANFFNYLLGQPLLEVKSFVY